MIRRSERVRERIAVLEAALSRFVEVSQACPGVRAVYVYGSMARGEVGPRSDLDVLVVRDTGMRRADRDLDLRKAFDHPVPIDVLVVTPQEFAERLPSTGYGRTILREAKLVYAV